MARKAMSGASGLDRPSGFAPLAAFLSILWAFLVHLLAVVGTVAVLLLRFRGF
jgi:hypothetical protein